MTMTTEPTKAEKDNALTRLSAIVEEYKTKLSKLDHFYLTARGYGLTKTMEALMAAMKQLSKDSARRLHCDLDIPNWSYGYGSRKRKSIIDDYWGTRNRQRWWWKSFVNGDKSELKDIEDFPYLYSIPLLNAKLSKAEFKFIHQLYRALSSHFVPYGEETQVVVTSDDKAARVMLSVPYRGKDREMTIHYRTTEYSFPLTDYITWLLRQLGKAFNGITYFGNGKALFKKGDSLNYNIIKQPVEKMAYAKSDRLNKEEEAIQDALL